MGCWNDAIRAAHAIHSASDLLTPDREMVDVKCLLRHVLDARRAQVRDYSISLKTLGLGGEYIYSQLLDYRNAAPPYSVIIVGKGCNRCWTRFSVAKELMHVLHDAPDTALFSAQSVTNGLREAFESRQRLSGDVNLCSEAFCLVLAMEVMIPWRLRGRIGDRMSKWPILDVATKLRIPVPILESYRDWFRETSAGLTTAAGLATPTDP